MFNYLFDKGIVAIQRTFNALPWLLIGILVILFLAAGGAFLVHDWVDDILKYGPPEYRF